MDPGFSLVVFGGASKAGTRLVAPSAVPACGSGAARGEMTSRGQKEKGGTHHWQGISDELQVGKLPGGPDGNRRAGAKKANDEGGKGRIGWNRQGAVGEWRRGHESDEEVSRWD